VSRGWNAGPGFAPDYRNLVDAALNRRPARHLLYKHVPTANYPAMIHAVREHRGEPTARKTGTTM
jgi:hypothetical protein